MKLRSLYNFVFLLYLLILSSCAQQGAPSGGPVDKTPPKIVSSNPENFSTNFSAHEIELEFNEYIQLDGLQQKMVVSPALKHLPETKIRGKALTISFEEDTLKPNTTYNFNLGAGVVDITERNPLDSNVFVFSTGDFIDSLTVSGVVKDVFSLDPVENTFVMLYNEMNDSVPLKKRPDYFGKTDAKGRFEIRYIKEGKYKLFALKEANKNYIYDMPDEQVAFLERPIIAGEDDSLQLYLFDEDEQQQYLKESKYEDPGKITLVFNLPTKNLSVAPLRKNLKEGQFTEELLPNKDTAVYWLPDRAGMDSLFLKITDNDSILDTLEIALKEKMLNQKKKGKKQREGVLKIQLNVSKELDLNKGVKIQAEHLVAAFDSTKIILLEDDSVKVNPSFSIAKTPGRKFILNYPWKGKKGYELLIPEGTFTDVFGWQNDTVRANFNTKGKDSYGTLRLKLSLKNHGHPFLLALLTEKGKIVKEQTLTQDETVNFNYLTPGAYKLRLIYDNNGNNEWDTGNYLKGRQPEKVIYYSGKVMVRANWDSDLEWKITD